MELFKVTCVTCRARLSVRDESAIGQIVACPRCGSMVHVSRPEGATTPAVAVAAASAVVQPLSNIPPAPPVTVSESFDSAAIPTPAVAAPTSPALGTPVAEQTAATFDDAADVLTASDGAAGVEGGPPMPNATPIPAAAAKTASYKFAAMLFGGAVAGSALVAATLWLTGGGEQPSKQAIQAMAETPTAKAPNTSELEAIDDEGAPSNAQEAGDEAAKEVVDAAAEDSTAGGDVDPFDAAAAGLSADEQKPENEPDPTAVKAQSAENADAGETNKLAVASTEAAPAEPAPKLRIDPLEIDPEGLDLTTLFRKPAPDSLAERELEEREVAPAPSAAAEPKPAALVPRLAAREAVRREAESAAPADSALLLARKFPAMKIEKMPLCRLLDLAVQVSGIPISVAPEELRLAGVSAGTAASVDVKNATVVEALAAALKPLRLAPVVDDGQILLRRIGEDRMREIPYAVEDLAAAGAETEQLAEWVQQLVAPETWRAGGGEGVVKIEGRTLRITQRERVQYETLLVLERLRLARGIPTRSKYPAALLTADAAQVALADRLGGPTTFTFSEYTPLREIFRYWQEELDTAVLVDWPALADERLTPTTRIAASAANEPWGEAMDTVLTPLGLAWRAVDRRTIEISTLAKVGSAPCVELYRLGADAAVDAERLDAEVNELAGAESIAAADAVTVYDASHRVLLVRAPASLHRRLAAKLAEQKLLAVR